MAVDPLPVLRRYDTQGLSKAVAQIATALNLGAVPVNHNLGSVAPNYVYYPFRSYVTTVLGLPAATAAGQGARAFVSDSQVSHVEGVGEVVEPGGEHKVPVYSDGTDWRIG